MDLPSKDARRYNSLVKTCVDQRITIWSDACVAASSYSFLPLPRQDHIILVLRDPRAVVVSCRAVTDPGWAERPRRLEIPAAQGKEP